MLRLLPGTLSILLTHLVLAAAFAGLGLALRRFYGQRRLAIDDLFFAFWTGFGVVMGLLLIWNFWLPVGSAALTVVLGAGAAGLLATRAELGALLRGMRRPPALVMAGGTVLLLVLANQGVGQIRNFDSSLYHMQGELWAHSYRAVPGLANLLGPLGFNNGSLLYAAMLDSWMWAGAPWHVANGLFVTVLVLHALAVTSEGDDAPSRQAVRLFIALVLALAVNAQLKDRAASFVTDVPLGMLALGMLARWYATLMDAARDEREAGFDAAALIFLCAVAVSVKVNASIFAATLSLAVAAAWVTRYRPPRALMARTAAFAVVGAGVVSVAYFARGIVLSGYPLFPSSFLPAPVPWRVPLLHTKLEFLYAYHSSRASVDNLPVLEGRAGIAAWLPNWLRHLADDPYYVAIPVILALIGAIACLLLARRPGRATARPGWWLLAPTIIPAVAWFVIAPEPRYIGQLLWGLAALAAAQAFLLAGRGIPRGAIAAAWLVAVSPLAITPLAEWMQGGRSGNPLRATLESIVRIPPRGHLVSPHAPPDSSRLFETRNGISIVVPRYRCWNLPLPCTHNPDTNLAWRVPGRMDGGFILDGPWAMADWPERWRPQLRPALVKSLEGAAIRP